LSTGWSHPVDKKSLQIQKLKHILIARSEWIRAEYALRWDEEKWTKVFRPHSARDPVCSSSWKAELVAGREGNDCRISGRAHILRRARRAARHGEMSLLRLLLADFLLCLRFCTRISFPVLGVEDAPHGIAGLARAVRMLPFVGGLVGGLAALVMATALAHGLPPTVASALAIGALVLLTGALHEDGLADCADGFGGGTSRERKLEIMRDSRLGTYGAIAVALTLYLRVESLAAIVTESAALASVTLIAAAAASRTAAMVPAILVPPARADGLGHAAGRPEPWAFTIAVALAALALLAPIPLGADPWAAGVGLTATVGIAIGATGLAYRQIGGHSGDVAGAVQQMSEVAVLVAFAAR
jgi:adenosylcobinamide-GDP ribazoletransferase